MCRAAIRVTAHVCLLVALPKVERVGIPIPKLEGTAPRAIHVDRVPCCLVAPKRMKAESGEVHVLRTRCRVQGIQPTQNSRMESRVDLRLARFPKSLRLLVGKGFDDLDVEPAS